MSTTELRQYLIKAKSLDEAGKTDDALDVIYDAIDDAFTAGSFAEIDADLQAIKVAEWSPTLLIGFLTTSRWARSHLPSRPAFYEAVRLHLVSIGKSESRLLHGLE